MHQQINVLFADVIQRIVKQKIFFCHYLPWIRYAGFFLLWGWIGITLGASVNYEYDSLGRLTGVLYEDGTSISYQYDANGNRSSAEIIPSGFAITTDELPEATAGLSYATTLSARGHTRQLKP